MAKHKAGKDPQKKVKDGNTRKIFIGFRTTTEDEAHTGTQKALKCGAVSIGSRVVGPNQIAAFATFSKKAAAKEFDSWLSGRHLERYNEDDD